MTVLPELTDAPKIIFKLRERLMLLEQFSLSLWDYLNKESWYKFYENTDILELT